MNIRKIKKMLFDEEEISNDVIPREEEISKKKILKAVFGKEEVQQEELWDKGFGLIGEFIEVHEKHISRYSKYKKSILENEILSNFYTIKIHWAELHNNQLEQIRDVMKIIAYGVISLEGCVTVEENINGATIQFLRNLGYEAQSQWIHLERAKKTERETKYITAETALNVANYINRYVFSRFLKDKISEGKEYVIIPVVDITKSGRVWNSKIEEYRTKIEEARIILESLNLDFELGILISRRRDDTRCVHVPLVFIDLRNVSIIQEDLKDNLDFQKVAYWLTAKIEC